MAQWWNKTTIGTTSDVGNVDALFIINIRRWSHLYLIDEVYEGLFIIIFTYLFIYLFICMIEVDAVVAFLLMHAIKEWRLKVSHIWRSTWSSFLIFYHLHELMSLSIFSRNLGCRRFTNTFAVSDITPFLCNVVFFFFFWQRYLRCCRTF